MLEGAIAAFLTVQRVLDVLSEIIVNLVIGLLVLCAVGMTAAGRRIPAGISNDGFPLPSWRDVSFCRCHT